jgi:hypothetical protein
LKQRKPCTGRKLADIPIRDHGECANVECRKILPDVVRRNGRWMRAARRKYCSGTCRSDARRRGSLRWIAMQKPWALEMLADVLPKQHAAR